MLFEKYKQTLIRLALVAAMSFVLSIMLFRPASAADYNCGAYGAGTYDNGAVCAATTPADSGGLTNTGQALAYGIPAGMILTGTIALFKTRKSRKSNSQAS